jgi:hypothetical protein
MHYTALRLKLVMIVLMVVLVGAAFTSALAQEDRFSFDIMGANAGIISPRDAASGLPTGK